MKFADLIAELSRSLNMDELAPGDDGAYAIVFDGELEIELVPMTQSRFLVRSRLPAIPQAEAEREELLRACLQRSLAHLHDAAATVTADRETGRLWIYLACDAGALDPRAMLELVEGFVNAAELWSRFEPEPKATGFGALPFNLMMRP